MVEVLINTTKSFALVPLLVFQCFLTDCLSQECELTGEAYLEADPDGTIAVQALDTSGSYLISFTTTDSQGMYRLDNIPNGAFLLRLSQLGYQDIIHQLVCKGTTVRIETDTLQLLSINLDEVSVVDRAVILRRQGDTTHVNFQLLERGNEQSVTDILRLVPGLRLSNDRYIFENKTIDMVLIDGIDLSDQDQKELTDGIFYESIDNIQIIENYSPIGELSFDSTDTQTAINISLSEAYQNKGQLSFSAQAGYDRAYHLASSYLNTGPKRGWRIYGNSLQNNRSDQGLDYAQEYLARELRASLFQNRYTILRPTELVFLHQVPRTQIQTNREQELRVFYDSRSNGISRTSGRFSFSHSKASVSHDGFREYFNQLDRVNTISSARPRELNLMGRFDYTSKLGNQGTVELSFPINFQNHRTNAEEVIGLAANQNINQQEESLNQFMLSPFYHLKWRYSSGWQLWILGRAKIAHSDRGFSIFSNDPIVVPSIFSIDQSRFRSSQQSEYVTAFTENQARLSRKINDLLLVANLSSIWYRDRFNQQTETVPLSPLSGQNRWFLNAYSVALRARYDLRKFRFGLQSNFLAYSTKTSSGSNEDIRFDPRFFLLYRLSRSLHVSSSYSVGIQLPNIEQTMSLSVQRNQIELFSGNLPTIRPTLKRTISLSFFKPPTPAEYGSFFNLGVTYSPAYERPISNTQLDSDFQQTDYDYIRIRRDWRANLFWMKNSRNGSIRLNARANTIEFRQSEVDIADKFISGSVGLDFKITKDFSASFGTDLNYIHRSSARQLLNASFSLSPELNLQYSKGNTIVEFYQRYRYNDFRLGQNRYYQLNMSFTRKKVFDRFELSIQGLDLLNLSPSIQSFSNIQQNYFETRNFRLLPGRVMLGLKWYVQN